MNEIAWLKSKDGSKKLGIELQGKEFPEIKTGFDAKWIVGGVYFESDAFEVSLENQPMYETGLLSKLVSDMGKIVDNFSGIAEYYGNEPYFQMKMDIKKNGVGTINGKIWNVLPDSVSIEFSFETDQSCVVDFHNVLRARLKGLRII